MRVIFAGTPAPAVPSLHALHNTSHDIVAVVTRPDAPQGRKRVLTPSPVAEAADALDLPVLKAARLDEEATRRIESLRADLGVIVAYGGLVREPLLSTPRLGWINLHFSLLPRWRGAAPVQHAIIAGDEKTGVSVFRLVAALDAGDLYAQVSEAIPPQATAGTLLEQLAVSGAKTLVDVVEALSDGSAVAAAQTGAVTLAPKLTLDDARVRWREPAGAVLGRIRGVTPEPGAHTVINGVRLKIIEASRAETMATLAPGRIRAVGHEVLIGTATDPVALLRVQPAGKQAMAAKDWWRGLHIDEGEVDA